MGSNLLALGIAASMWATPIMPPHYNPPIYNIPLSVELQNHTYRQCKRFGVDFELALAVMQVESDFQCSLISKANDHGIMQVNRQNHDWLGEELGITDFLDPKQNIAAGIYILGLLTQRWDDTHQLLMAYNMGERKAREAVKVGVKDTHYSRKVMKARDELEQV